jgi:hypothetical protein
MPYVEVLASGCRIRLPLKEPRYLYQEQPTNHNTVAFRYNESDIKGLPNHFFNSSKTSFEMIKVLGKGRTQSTVLGSGLQITNLPEKVLFQYPSCDDIAYIQ